MPPALPDPLVGWASGPVGAERNQASLGLQNSQKGAHASPSAPRTRSNSALEALLVDLGPQIQRAGSMPHASLPHELPHEERNPKDENGPSLDSAFDRRDTDASRFCATGLESLDARLGGGLPRGRLSEICGPPSSGRTALALTLVGHALGQGALAGWIDLPDAFDPHSASASGVTLERLLWVRPRSEKQALQSCDRLLQTEGFELVVFDCVTTGSGATGSGPARAGRGRASAPSISDVAWLRLSRLAAKTSTALVVLSQPPIPSRPSIRPSAYSSVTGSRAAVVLEMRPLDAHFVGSPRLLESLETTAVLRRHRTRPSGGEVPLFVHTEEHAEEHAEEHTEEDFPDP